MVANRARFRVGTGSNQGQTTIRFIAPVGYPYANPDCFWADQSLRLASGGMPQASNITTIPETNITGVWFSWHLTKPWNPNSDTLLNWLATDDRQSVERSPVTCLAFPNRYSRSYKVDCLTPVKVPPLFSRSRAARTAGAGG